MDFFTNSLTSITSELSDISCSVIQEQKSQLAICLASFCFLSFRLLLRLHQASSSCSTDTVMNFICTKQMILKQQILTFTSFMHSARLPWRQFLSRLSHPLHLCFSASLRKQTLVQILMDTMRHSAVKWENKNRFNQRCVLV